MSYTAPVKDMLFAIEHLARIDQVAQIPGFEAGAAQAVPLQRIAEPEDHTGHYVLLASRENAGLTTANIIHSDGGWEIRSAGPTRSRKA